MKYRIKVIRTSKYDCENFIKKFLWKFLLISKAFSHFNLNICSSFLNFLWICSNEFWDFQDSKRNELMAQTVRLKYNNSQNLLTNSGWYMKLEKLLTNIKISDIKSKTWNIKSIWNKLIFNELIWSFCWNGSKPNKLNSFLMKNTNFSNDTIMRLSLQCTAEQ